VGLRGLECLNDERSCGFAVVTMFGGVEGGVKFARLKYRGGGCVALELADRGCICSGVDMTVGRMTGEVMPTSSDESKSSELDDERDDGGEGRLKCMCEDEYMFRQR
jgi:hypothetical protein